MACLLDCSFPFLIFLQFVIRDYCSWFFRGFVCRIVCLLSKKSNNWFYLLVDRKWWYWRLIRVKVRIPVFRFPIIVPWSSSFIQEVICFLLGEINIDLLEETFSVNLFWALVGNFHFWNIVKHPLLPSFALHEALDRLKRLVQPPMTNCLSENCVNFQQLIIMCLLNCLAA